MYFFLSLLTFVSIAAGAPAEKRQFLNGFLGSLAGVVGIESTFDYVIVGGGTGGLAMAERLSKTYSVALIEAGTVYQVTSPIQGDTPSADVLWVGASPSDTNPLVDWNFVTAPQSGANGRSIHYARGKCLGGSSARNFMVYQRPDRGSLQQWADSIGDQSYTFDNMLPYFKKSVAFTPPTSKRAANASAEFNAAAFSPSGGPLDVSYANYAQPFSSWMEASLNEIGVPQIQDFNSGNLLGAQYASSTIQARTQLRESSQTSFLNAASGRSNLRVYTLTTAKKILFDSSKKATGVRVSTVGTLGTYTVRARREVIVSAGAFQSPQLLMVSGIGPAADLSRFGIPVIADRSGVGQNMSDHIFFGPSYRVNVNTLTRLANDPLYLAAQTAAFLTQSGALTNPVCDFIAFEKVPRSLLSSTVTNALSSFPASWPEIEYITAPGYIGNFANLFTTQPKDGYQYATILAALVAPLSRGTVTLRSSDTSDLPIIDPKWLVDPTDAAVAVAAYKRARAAFKSSAMASVLTDPTEYFPGPAVQSDAQILEVIRNTLMTVWHAAGTCRMGKSSDPTAVVDNKARVIGVQGVRVVDASSFALLPPGHPQSMIYALAEKIADDILNGN